MLGFSPFPLIEWVWLCQCICTLFLQVSDAEAGIRTGLCCTNQQRTWRVEQSSASLFVSLQTNCLDGCQSRWIVLPRQQIKKINSSSRKLEIGLSDAFQFLQNSFPFNCSNWLYSLLFLQRNYSGSLPHLSFFFFKLLLLFRKITIYFKSLKY